MAVIGRIKMQFNRLPLVVKAIGVGGAQCVNQTAVRVSERAKAAVPSLKNPGPFATGALQAAIHVVTEDRSDYEKATTEAERIRAVFATIDSTIEPLGPFIQAPIPLRSRRFHTRAIVVAPLSYAHSVELGGFSEAYSPRAEGPFMGPSAAAEREAYGRRFTTAMRHLELVAKSGSGAPTADPGAPTAVPVPSEI